MREAVRDKRLPQLPEFPTVRSDPRRKDKAGKLHPEEIIVAWLARLAATPNAKEAWLQAWVLISTGLRVSEVRRLDSTWLEPASAAVREKEPSIRGFLQLPDHATKTRKERVVGITGDVWDALMGLVREKGTGTPLLPSDHKRQFRSAREAIDYPIQITPRDLRHCYGTLATHGTGDLVATQAALGHADPRTTQRYLSSTQARTGRASVAVQEALQRAERGVSGADTPAGHTQKEQPAKRRVVSVEASRFELLTLCVQSRCSPS